MSSSRARFSLHISARVGEERRERAEGVKKAKKCKGDEWGRNRVMGGWKGRELKYGGGETRRNSWKEQNEVYSIGLDITKC